jgi:hypothetical protein
MLKPMSALERAERQLAEAIAHRQRTRPRTEPDTPPPSSLADLGVSVSEAHAAALRSWTDANRSSVGGDSNATFMDATCIETARMLIDGRHEHTVGPLSLLDLSTFVTAYCLFDRIAFLHNDMFAATELHHIFGNNMFVELPVRTTEQPKKGIVDVDVRRALYDVYLYTVLPRLEMLYSEEPPSLAKAVRDGWRTLLGADPGNPSLKLHRQLPFAAQGSSSAGTPNLDSLSRELTQDTQGAQKSLDEFALDPKFWSENRLRVPVAESNGRSIFNLAISEMLRLPYSCSAGRLPYRRYLYQQAQRRDAGMAKRIARSSPEAVRFIEQNYDSVLGRIDTTTRLNLPPFLAAVLARVTDACEIPEAMADLRRQAGPFRKNLERLNACVKSGIRDQGDARGINAMLRALQDDAALLRRNALGSAVLKRAVAVAVPAAIAAHTLPNSGAPWEAILFQASASGISVLADLVDREFLEKLGRRLFRREYWFLTRLGSSLRATTGGWDRVQQIWNVSNEHEEYFLRRFGDIAKLRYT